MEAVLIAVGVAAIAGVLIARIVSAARRPRAARATTAGETAGPDAAFYTAGSASPASDCAASSSDAGCDGGGGN